MDNKKAIEYYDELILNYLTGSLTSTQIIELHEWIKESANNHEYFIQKYEIWFSSLPLESNDRYNKDEAFKEFEARLQQQQVNKPPRKSVLYFLFRYSAIVIIVFTLAYYFFTIGRTTVQDTFQNISVEAPAGSKTKLYLPDGSLVWLNNGSKITYSQGFGVTNRNIDLNGEGYFEVKKNKNLPFLVTTRTFRVQVLGTVFDCKDYPEDDEAFVSLFQGKVELRSLQKKGLKAILLPGRKAIINKSDGSITFGENMHNKSQWKEDIILFDEETLSKIVKELERSYNAKIRVKNDSLETFRFYGQFNRSEQSLEDVLNALSATGKIKYTIEQNQITIY